MREPELVDQSTEPMSRLDRVEILALEVLDERDLESGPVVQLSNDRGDALQPSGDGRPKSSLPRDEFVAVDRFGDEDRLEHAVLADACGQRGEFRGIEVPARLVRIGPNTVNADLRRARRALGRAAG